MKAKRIAPFLRFKKYSNNWNKLPIEVMLSRVSNPVDVIDFELYQQIGIRSHGKGIFHKEYVSGKSLGNKRVFWVKPNSLVVNIVFAWEHAIAKTTEAEAGMIASHRFPMYVPKNNLCSIDFLLHFFLTKKGKALLELASPGGAGRNKTLGQKEFEKLTVFVPSNFEQQNIADFLTKMDEKIKQLSIKKSLLEKYKKACLQQIVSKNIRFKNDDGKNYPDWEPKKLCEVLEYEQPTKYLVSSKDYDDDFEVPVLTAGKTFILGYTNEKNGIFCKNLPVIIFDDFTTANKFVDFSFKAKSSAMKILKAKDDSINIRLVYELMQMIEYAGGDNHKRRWISEYQNFYIELPSISEQKKISDFLSTIDTKINLISLQLQTTRLYKNGLVQKMFINA